MMELAHLIAFTVNGSSFAHLTFNFLAPKLYANSLMASLNARTLILADDSSDSSSGFDDVQQTTAGFSFRHGPAPTQTLEYASFNAKVTASSYRTNSDTNEPSSSKNHDEMGQALTLRSSEEV